MNKQMNFARFAVPDEKDRRCTRIETEIVIGCSAHHVFNYVTNPTLWATWHPATVGVRACAQRPLVKSESMLETISAIGRKFEARWTVLACEHGRVWIIGTETPEGAARIVYDLTTTDDGCRFHRTLEFRSKRAPWRFLDSTFTRWMLLRQSRRALQNLKRVLESSAL